MFFVYVLQNPEGRLYIGFTNNLEKRVSQHQQNKAGWTRNKGPWKLVYHEQYINRIDAMKRERNLKRGKTNKELRQLLINGSMVEGVLQGKDSPLGKRRSNLA